MKQLMLVCLLVTSAVAAAQTPTPNPNGAPQRGGKNSEVADVELNRPDAAKREAEDAKREADEAKTRAKLDEARARLDKAAREVAELSSELGRSARRDMIFINAGGGRQAVLGVQIDDSDKRGARVRRVSPGGPAEEAGLRDGDIITSLDGKTIAGGDDAGRIVVETMRDVKPEQKVKVRVLREGKNKEFVVVTRPMVFDKRTFHVQMPEGAIGAVGPVGAMGPTGPMGPMPMVQHFRGFFSNEFGGMELASLTPKLGTYFGANDGVLVVKAPENDVFKLEDGDVIQSIDGRKPDDGAHAMRILRSYQAGEKLSLNVLRQRKAVNLSITMPERPEFGEGFRFEGAVPPPPLPPPPGVPGGAGTLE